MSKELKYAREGHENVRELEEVLDELIGTETVWPVEIYEFRPMKVDWELQKRIIICELYERLEADYGDPDGHVENEPSNAVFAAADDLIEAVKKNYHVWMYEQTGNKITFTEEEAHKFLESLKENLVSNYPSLKDEWEKAFTKEEAHKFLESLKEGGGE